MTVTNTQSGTNVHEVADGIYRINTPVKIEGAGGFSFNQFLIVDDEPLLFHTGLRKMFPLVREAVVSVLPVARLRHIAFSHVEADECGSLNEWLGAAPQAGVICSQVGAMVSVNDFIGREARAPPDGGTLTAGEYKFRSVQTTHPPASWDARSAWVSRSRIRSRFTICGANSGCCAR